ncbi:hypothetical protein [Paenibacillus periandrae]|uniref:hypothetical protein n=1 Tax=Paenibacillus periandrae TaxID=1761741 RepID=UPI001F0943B4|nr:hypothetical protein [Paenibacillus periandrae]
MMMNTFSAPIAKYYIRLLLLAASAEFHNDEKHRYTEYKPHGALVTMFLIVTTDIKRI